MKAKVKTWLKNIENGKIQNLTEKILAKIKEETPEMSLVYDFRRGISTYELRKALEISHQSLTAILSALTDEGLIKAIGEHNIADSTYSFYMFISDLEYRKILIMRRKKEKYLNWLKKSDDYFDFMSDETCKMICYEQHENGI